MNYTIPYICISHIGRCRHMNQDNYICDGQYRDPGAGDDNDPQVLSGRLHAARPALLGVLDGLGGEECGEVASLLAAREAAATALGDDPAESLREYCRRANCRICHYAEQNGIQTMGTTAALLAFDAAGVTICNIGDSKIFCFSGQKAQQISEDHLAAVPDGVKAPLSQCLGIPPAEMLISPYTARRACQIGDRYLICSDGLTDMVSLEEMEKVVTAASARRKRPSPASAEHALSAAARQLVDRALQNGGRDNLTLILCEVLPEG